MSDQRPTAEQLRRASDFCSDRARVTLRREEVEVAAWACRVAAEVVEMRERISPEYRWVLDDVLRRAEEVMSPAPERDDRTGVPVGAAGGEGTGAGPCSSGAEARNLGEERKSPPSPPSPPPSGAPLVDPSEVLRAWLEVRHSARWLVDVRYAGDDLAGAVHNLVQERDAARREVEQLQVQLAGCGVAALGGTAPDQRCAEGTYGWSPSYRDVLNLRLRYDAALKRVTPETLARYDEARRAFEYREAEFADSFIAAADALRAEAGG